MDGEQSHSDRQPRVALVHHFLDDAAARRPSATAVRDEERAWTYRELHERGLRVMTWLADHGIGRGDRVLVRLPNTRHMTALLYRVMRIGAVLVPVSHNMRPYELSRVLRDAGPKMVITEASERIPTSSAATVLTLGEVGSELRRCVLWVRGALRDVEVLRGIADRLGPARLPDRCLVIDALPRTSNGKIDKLGLEHSLCDGER